MDNMDNTPQPLKECQMCKKHLTLDHFYKRKNRKGEYSWKTSYCKPCKYIQVNADRKQHIQSYRTYQKEYGNTYYHSNKDKISIIQKRYYYNKLPPDKQLVYLQKLKQNYPHLVDSILSK